MFRKGWWMNGMGLGGEGHDGEAQRVNQKRSGRPWRTWTSFRQQITPEASCSVLQQKPLNRKVNGEEGEDVGGFTEAECPQPTNTKAGLLCWSSG